MGKSQENTSKDDTLVFAQESNPLISEPKPLFKLLIVDDENEIHVMTKLVLADYQYQGAGLEFLSAFTGKQAKIMIKENPDIACCLLDVVMETKNAGLEVARFIREDEKNLKLRIILRTGQPGQAPEKDIIVNYDINDFKEKTELTDQKLFTTITTALRSYKHLEKIEEKQQEILSKNLRLNEEIARRIVAESNLTKYNRSLEKMIEDKSNRLKDALLTLEMTKSQLQKTRKSAMPSEISNLTLDTLDRSNTLVESNLKKIDHYGQSMALLLEQYSLLEKILTSTAQGPPDGGTLAETIQGIENYKTQIDLDTLLKNYPKFIQASVMGIKEISRVISDIKLFVSIDKEPCQPTDIPLLLEKASGARTPDPHKKIDIQLELEKVPLVPLPARHMEKAVSALLDNAFQSIDAQGIISISCQYLSPDVIISISDLGCGISTDDLPHIFDPYFTGARKGGKGLGLTFARSVIQNCKGEIRVTSSLHQGTTVKILLPLEAPGASLQ
jgi:two-component system, NtrC family, sensor kinase